MIESDRPPSTNTPLPTVTEHGCYLLYTVRYPEEDFSSKPRLTLKELLASPDTLNEEQAQALAWITEEVRDTASDRQLVQPVWEAAPLNVGTDLHPHIRRLLGEAGEPDAPAHAQTYHLTDLARRLVQGELLRYPPDLPQEERRPKVLSLRLSKAARERLAARLGQTPPDTLGLTVEQIRLVVFRTGFGVLVVTVSCRNPDDGPLHPYWLVEAVVGLTQLDTLCWRNADGRERHPVRRFGLDNLVRSLGGAGAIGGPARRVFTATYVQFAESPDPVAAQRYAVQLSRHYTDHYRIAVDPQGVCAVADFENVRHVLALEGSATLVDAVPPPGLETPEFIETFRTAAFERHYLPIAVLALHEFTILGHLTNDSSFWPITAGEIDTTQVKRLARLRDRILGFRLCYRFSHVSGISMHNAVNAGFRKVFGLDWMLRELDQDTAEIHAYLEQASAARNERRFRWASVIGGGGLAWLTTFTIVKELLEAVHLGSHDTPALAGVVTGVVAGIVAIWVLLSDGHGGGHLQHHAIREQVTHRALHEGERPD